MNKIIFSLFLAIILSACATSETKCGPFNANSHDCMVQRLRDVDAYRDLKKMGGVDEY
ncbi:MAG: hypothetical protein HQL08_03785 [Nitrospirae bacterium]|nr:hypothetical protein [Nitrospirota bacterium]